MEEEKERIEHMGTAVIIIILLLIVFLACRSSLKHFKGKGGCCGDEGESVSEGTKELKDPVIGKKIVHIEGMHCENCKNSVERQINKLEGASCKVNLKKKIAEVSFDREIDDEDLRIAVERLDYQVTGIERS